MNFVGTMDMVEKVVLVVKFRATIKFFSILLDNNIISRITEGNTITTYTTFILGNPHGGENLAKLLI